MIINSSLKVKPLFLSIFSLADNTTFCREGYINAEGALEHFKEIKEVLDKVLDLIGKNNLDMSVTGTKTDLEKLKPALTSFGATFYQIDRGAIKSI